MKEREKKNLLSKAIWARTLEVLAQIFVFSLLLAVGMAVKYAITPFTDSDKAKCEAV